TTKSKFVRIVSRNDDNLSLRDMKRLDFNGLFVFELANNHEGDLSHGLRIIRAMGEIARYEKVRAAVKFQFRQLETFLHPDLAKRPTKHAERFARTKLSRLDFNSLLEATRSEGMLALCT